MKIRLTSKALSGKSVTLILEQDGRSAGPLTVADWGGTTQAEETPAPPSPAPPPPAPGPGLDGGIVSITVDRTSLRCAPDSVRLGVDLSNSTFDTPGPAPGANYDPRLHELVYIWDTGDTGEWSAPENVLAEWNDKSKGRGPWIAHCYDAPGTYTVRLTVIEPSSGKQAQATASITVEDPNDVYAGAETVCINPPGDDNFTGAPDGAMTVQMDGVSVKVRDQSWWNSVKGNTKRRFLLKAGATYGPVAFELNYSDDPPHFYLGTYGSGTVHVPTPGAVNRGRVITMQPRYRGYETPEMNDVRVTKVITTGTFDPTTMVRETPGTDDVGGELIRTDKYGDFVISRCGTSNNKTTPFAFYLPQGNGNSQDFRGYIHLNDCYADNFGGQYSGAFASGHDAMIEATMAVTGCRFRQDPHSISGGSQWRAPFRENGHHRFYLACSEAFGKEDSNTGWKIINTPRRSDINHIVNIWGIAIEGNLAPLDFGQNNVVQGTKISFDANIIVDGGLILGDYSTTYFIQTTLSGVTLRNIWATCPNVPRFANENFSEENFDKSSEESQSPYVRYITRTFRSGIEPRLVTTAGQPSEAALNAPISVYNCTFSMDRPIAENGNYRSKKVLDNSGFNNVIEANNIWDGPWAGQAEAPNPDAPLSASQLFTPRNIGWKGYVTRLLRTEFATPTTAARARAPLAGSAALGAALTGPTAIEDISGKLRPVYPSRGAWEAP